MSTETDVTRELRNGSPAPVSTADVKVVVASHGRAEGWRRRPVQIGALVVVVLLVAAIVGNNLIGRQYTPEAAVRSYLNALRAGNASDAWSSVDVAAPPSPADTSLVASAALRAALAARKPDLQSFVVDKTSTVDSSHAAVTVSASTSTGSRDMRFVVTRSGEAKFGLYPDWRVVLQPVLLSVAGPKGAAGLSIDGKQLSLPAGSADIAVLPLGHRVVFSGTPFLMEQAVDVDAFGAGNQAVPYQPKLTTTGTQQAQTAITAYFTDVCAKQTSTIQTPGCPQAPLAYVQYSGHWTVIGDPGQGLALSIDSDGGFVLGGHYQMS